MSLQLRQLLVRGLGQASRSSFEAVRSISNSAGVSGAEPQLATKAAEEGLKIGITLPSSQEATLPRWERDLGAIRTDWT